MSMNVGGSEEEQGVMSNINTTPLVDVMLVLLIIFLITIPVINKSVPVDLPKAVNIRRRPSRKHHGAVDKKATSTGTTADAQQGRAALPYQEAAVRVPQPEVHIRADRDAKFEAVGRVLYAIQRGGVVKVGFLRNRSWRARHAPVGAI